MSKIDYNEHLVNAVKSLPSDYDPIDTQGFITHKSGHTQVNNSSVTFCIQSGPVSEFGRNGCDATEIIRFAIGLYRSFNTAHGCKENSCAITKLEEALHWQEARTRDRVNRKVEGKDQD